MSKRRNILIALLLLAAMLPTQAQVFMMEDDNDPNRNVLNVNGQYNNVPFHGSTDDQANFVPLGSGALLLAALGGAYLTGKRKKEA